MPNDGRGAEEFRGMIKAMNHSDPTAPLVILSNTTEVRVLPDQYVIVPLQEVSHR